MDKVWIPNKARRGGLVMHGHPVKALHCGGSLVPPETVKKYGVGVIQALNGNMLVKEEEMEAKDMTLGELVLEYIDAAIRSDAASPMDHGLFNAKTKLHREMVVRFNMLEVRLGNLEAKIDKTRRGVFVG